MKFFLILIRLLIVKLNRKKNSILPLGLKKFKNKFLEKHTKQQKQDKKIDKISDKVVGSSSQSSSSKSLVINSYYFTILVYVCILVCFEL